MEDLLSSYATLNNHAFNLTKPHTPSNLGILWVYLSTSAVLYPAHCWAGLGWKIHLHHPTRRGGPVPKVPWCWQQLYVPGGERNSLLFVCLSGSPELNEFGQATARYFSRAFQRVEKQAMKAMRICPFLSTPLSCVFGVTRPHLLLHRRRSISSWYPLSTLQGQG